MTLHDQQFDPEKPYIARRNFTMGGKQYATGDPVPIAESRGEDHLRRLYVARWIRLADKAKPNGFHHEEPAPPMPAPSSLASADASAGASLPPAEANPIQMQTFNSSGSWTKPGGLDPNPTVVTREWTGDAEIAAAGGGKKTEPERLPGGTTTRYIEHTGRGWHNIHWDGMAPLRVRGFEAAVEAFAKLQTQDGAPRGETVVAHDAPEGAGGEAPREDPGQPLAPWVEDGKDQTDLP